MGGGLWDGEDKLWPFCKIPFTTTIRIKAVTLATLNGFEYQGRRYLPVKAYMVKCSEWLFLCEVRSMRSGWMLLNCVVRQEAFLFDQAKFLDTFSFSSFLPEPLPVIPLLRSGGSWVMGEQNVLPLPSQCCHVWGQICVHLSSCVGNWPVCLNVDNRRALLGGDSTYHREDEAVNKPLVA